MWRAAASLTLIVLMAVGCSEEEAASFCAVAVADSPAIGPADAWVTVVEFADFECPYCSNAAATLGTLLDAYPDDLRLVFKHLPLSFHQRALPAAVAAQCAHEQGLFWPMHDLLFAQPKALEEADLVHDGEEAGLDMDAFAACRGSNAAAARVQQDVQVAGDIGVTATPTMFINGTPYAGARPFDELQQVVESARTQAAESGTARDAYYDALGARACEKGT